MEEQRFVFFTLSEEASAQSKLKKWQKVALYFASVIIFGLMAWRFGFLGIVGGMLGPIFGSLANDIKPENRLSQVRLQFALDKTKDFAAAESAIHRILPNEVANTRVAALRAWWATQSPVPATASVGATNNLAPTQSVEWRP